ncbi:MAG: hypothetical protein MJ062_06895 [Oscillospiraceae bacterium]|nr:hypothetical protein [Oscillospiraceae bacterium]
MTIEELKAKVDAALTGDAQTDIHYINTLSESVKREENAEELVSVLAEYAFDLLPDDQKKYMLEATFVRDMRMDKAFGEALKMIDAGKLDDAEQLLSEISDKIRTHFEEGETLWFSFRNPFEYHLYRTYYPTTTEFERAPFDFAHYLTIYGYVLLEQHKLEEAAAAVERGISFNPVNADYRFELAEICKLGRNADMLLRVNQDTLRVCTSADRIARTLCNMGYFCNMIGDLFSAGVFYFESIRFNPSKAVEWELQDVVRHMKEIGQKFNPPTHGQVIDTYEKYGLQPPPNDTVVELAVTLGKQAHGYGKPELEGLFYRIAYDLTREPEFLEIVKQVDEKLGFNQPE